MAYPRRQATFRFTEQTHELLDILGGRIGLDRTATLERLVRAEAVLASKTDAELSGVLCRTPKDYMGKSHSKKAPGRKKKAAPTVAPDVPPPPPATQRSAGLPVW